jgi:hypothetical protein
MGSLLMTLEIALFEGWRYVLSGIGLFIATFAISILVIGFLLVKLPATYFLDSHDRELWIDQHPVLRWSGIIAKNLLGVAIIALGVLLSVPGIPGQGLLTILIGLVLLDFPGKRRLERWILKRPRVLDRVNALRRRYGKSPLVLDDERPHSGQ